MKRRVIVLLDKHFPTHKPTWTVKRINHSQISPAANFLNVFHRPGIRVVLTISM